MQSLAASYKIGKGLILAEIKHDVYIIFVFKVAIKADNALVMEWAVNLDLTGQLLSGFWASKIDLGDYFQGPSHSAMFFSLNWGESLDFVSFGKATLHFEFLK